MATALASLAEKGKLMGEDGALSEAEIRAEQYVHDIIKKMEFYVQYDSYPNFTIMQKAKIMLDTYKIANGVEFSDPIDEGVWIEVISFMLATRELDVSVDLRCVLFGTNLPGSPFYGVDASLPEQYNYILCYNGWTAQDYLNKEHYTDSKVYRLSDNLDINFR